VHQTHDPRAMRVARAFSAFWARLAVLRTAHRSPAACASTSLVVFRCQAARVPPAPDGPFVSIRATVPTHLRQCLPRLPLQFHHLVAILCNERLVIIPVPQVEMVA